MRASLLIICFVALMVTRLQKYQKVLIFKGFSSTDFTFLIHIP
jgi:hypothetical protein